MTYPFPGTRGSTIMNSSSENIPVKSPIVKDALPPKRDVVVTETPNVTVSTPEAPVKTSKS